MSLLPTEKISGIYETLIHQDTQQHHLHTDLTMAEIFNITSAGSLDFGGSEFEPAETELINPEKKNPDDEYGWWKLDSGTYRAQFNEKAVLPEYKLGVLLPHQHTDQAGLIMNSRLIFRYESSNGELQTTFHVPNSGTAIKENARIASLFILE
ncbi:hypothetical protein BH23BAC3_BH23BAC3_34540 [soil metagenome]